jgi:hypothetical protein
MRSLIAFLVFGALATIGIGMLRSLVGRTPHAHDPEDAVTQPADVRIVFRCENCGTELLLLRRGSETAPRHCGEGMTLREEIARS